MKNKGISTRMLVLLAMFAAIAYIIVALIRIPVVSFLSYEPKDVIITVCSFLFGPLSALAVSLVVSLVEMVTISDTGPIGALMNFLSTCCFACTAGIVYKHRHTQKGAVLGLILGSVAMVAVMLLWNWLITPLYMGVPRQQVAGMLLPVFLPFNALKAGLNTAITLFLYKPLVTALRKARLLEGKSAPKGSGKPAVYLLAALLLSTCVLLLLVLRGIL